MRKYTDMKPENIDITAYSGFIKSAEDGDIKAAKILMIDAAIFLQHNARLPEQLSNYIGEAIFRSAISDQKGGEDISKAFHLKSSKRSRNKYTQNAFKRLVCMEVQLAYLSVGHYEASRGIGAYEIVANKYGYKNPDSVKKIFTANHREYMIKDHTAEQLQYSIKIAREWDENTRRT